MATVALVLLWTILVLLAVALVIVLAPIRIRVTGQSEAPAYLRVSLGLVDGIVPDFAPIDTRRPKASKPRAGAADKKRQRGTEKSGGALTLEWSRIAKATPRLLADVVGTVEIRKLELSARFGTGDPADTGTIYGHLTPVLYGLGASRTGIDVTPDFRERRLDGKIDGDIRFTPAWLVPAGIRFAWSAFGPRR